MKIVEFANSIDTDEMAHIEPPHLALHCLPSSLRILNVFSNLTDLILLSS